MRLLTLACLFSITSAGVAQEDLIVLKGEPGGVPPRKLLSTYLLAEAQKHFDARRAAVAALKTPDDLQKRQAVLRAKFIDSLGGFPERTPLNAQVVGKEARDGYRIEKVIYESRPNHHVTATLYLPEGKPPYPGVLMPIGHSSNGKAAEYIQRGSILLARNGIAVLAYDPIGQGERRQLLDETGKPAIGSSTSEHTLAGVGALLVGRNTASYRIWDGMRSLDYLAGRPEIDSKRLGCTGCSGGGTLTSYLMALDDRIVAAAPSCYVTSLERLFATLGPQDAEQNITGQVAFGMEHADYLTMRAPRPTLICAATRDFFDIQGTWTSFREAKLLFGLLGHGERIDLVEYNTGHGYPRPQREAVTRWMRRWLLDKDDAPVETDFVIAKDADLRCTRTGQVLEEFKGKSVFHLNAERTAELAVERAKRQGGEGLLKEVRRLLAVPESVKPAARKQAGEMRRPLYSIRKLIFETEPGVAVPALHCMPLASTGRLPLILYVSGRGMAEDARPGGPIEKLVQSGRHVLALDPRGIGETAPAAAPAKPGPFGVDFKESYLALHLARPLLGQRVLDVLAVMAGLGREAVDGFEVIGIGTGGLIVLHAAALEPRIKQATVEQSLIAWAAVVQTPVNYDQLTNVVPGVLQVYDLPELAAAVAPRPLTIRSPVDPAQKPVTAAVLRDAYAPCRAAYARQKAEKELVLQPAP